VLKGAGKRQKGWKKAEGMQNGGGGQSIIFGTKYRRRNKIFLSGKHLYKICIILKINITINGGNLLYHLINILLGEGLPQWDHHLMDVKYY
jgi:hypothetical protein